MLNRLIPGVSRVYLTLARQYRGRSVPDPGVSRRLQIVRSDTPEVVRAGINEHTVEDMESDFFNSKDIRDEHKREMDRIRRKIEFSSVERKYFKKKFSPNMLLWSEKEQIRQLYHSEPENWTMERLANSFPATIDVVKKIVNSSWKPDSSERVLKHDEKVKVNWKHFTEGKLVVDEEIRYHLSKFTSRRDIVFQEASKVPAVITSKKDIPETVSKTFISIVKPTAAKQSIPSASSQASSNQDTYLIKENDPRVRKIRHHLTLDEMRRETINSGSNPGNLSEAFEKGKTTGERPLVKGLINPERPELKDMDKKEWVTRDGQQRAYVPDDELPKKIHIPSDKRVKGKLYRVKNYFYTDDGEFLYRI